MQLRIREAVVLVKVRQMIANKTVLLRVLQRNRRETERYRKTYIHIHTHIWIYVCVWKIPWTEEPGRWQSMGLRRVGHD